MLFDTPVFFLFLVVVVAIYWRLPRRGQNIFLLIASYFFYGWWDYRFLLLMAGSTIIDFVVARKLQSTESPVRRRTLLTLSLVLNFTFLGIFKYFNFFADSFVSSLHVLGFNAASISFLRIILPPGISFYTFQEVAYIVDVYHRKLNAADSLVEYALFISLFPHLIAGPIQRPSHLLPQVQRPRRYDPTQFFGGLMLIVLGLFRKCVIADNCALLANGAFNGRFGLPNIAVVLLGTYAFAWQIYGDFSGYSDIARGCAQLMGFHFMVNFRQPYLATTLQDFWRRWHISLSTWLRDYLYIPLGGSAHGERQTYRNLLWTMLLGGLWHGANWTFVVWGGIHGGVLAIERFFRKALARGEKQAKSNAASLWNAWFRRIFIFNLVCLAWIFFRAESLKAAWLFLGGLRTWAWTSEYTTASKFLLLYSVPLFLVDLYLERSGEEYVFEHRSPMLRTAAAAAMFVIVTLFTARQANAFIYFQF